MEHLLRDIQNTPGSQLSAKISSQLLSLKQLHLHISKIIAHLEKPHISSQINHKIMYNLQDLLNLIPNITDLTSVRSFAHKTNDEMLVIYVSSMIRAVTALHDLCENKWMLGQIEGAPEESKKAVVALDVVKV